MGGGRGCQHVAMLNRAIKAGLFEKAAPEQRPEASKRARRRKRDHSMHSSRSRYLLWEEQESLNACGTVTEREVVNSVFLKLRCKCGGTLGRVSALIANVFYSCGREKQFRL